MFKQIFESQHYGCSWWSMHFLAGFCDIYQFLEPQESQKVLMKVMFEFTFKTGET